MKKKLPLSIILFFSYFISVQSSLFAQTNYHQHSHKAMLKKLLPKVPNYKFSNDSLIGFDEATIDKAITDEGFIGDDVKRVSYLFKRKFIDEKYLIGKYAFPKKSSVSKLGNSNPSTQSLDCAAENFDFENGSGSGWALSGNTQIVSTGTDPYGNFYWVYPGTGSYSLKISDDVSPNGDFGQAIKTIAVPANGKTLFTFHFAMSLFGYPHTAAQAAKFKVDFFDASNNPIACPKYECYHSTDNGDVGVSNFTNTPNPASTYNSNAVGDTPSSNPATTANWNDVTLDLTAYAGQTISARFRIDWCFYGPDWAYCLVDADCPVNNFTPIPVCGGAGSNICGPPNMLSYNWQTPSGSVLTTSCISAATSGIYTLEVVPTNVQCSAAPTFTYLFGVSESPNINISANPACLNSSTTFTNNSTITAPDVINTHEWDFNNDGVTDDNIAQPTHLYPTAGSYTVNYTATASSGCKSTGTIVVTVYDNPIATFTANEVCFNSPTHFQDQSNGNGSPITNYFWDFTGDNVADITGPNNLNFTLPLLGNNTVNYTVSSTPITGLTCKSSTTQIVVTDAAPQAAFVFTNNCINNQPNYFDGSGSSTATGSIVSYDWNFGDSQISSSTISTTNHIYSLPIVYTVSLTVTSDKGCINTISKQVEVFAKPIAQITSKPKVCLGSPTTFTVNQKLNSGNIVSWTWDVDNTINSMEVTGQSGTYLYNSAGTQTLHVVTTTDHGCKDTMFRTVYVNYNPNPQFIVDDPDGCPLPHCVLFTDQTPAITSPAQINNWNWNFGNGTSQTSTSSTNQNTCYTNKSSSQLALYTVTLTTKTDSGCVASIVKPDFITVYPTPIANYTIVPEFGNVVVPLVHFVNQSIDYTTVNWSFGDGKTDLVTINPSHNYEGLSANEYYTSLVVTNQYGCSDTAKLVVPILPEFVFYIPNAFSPNADGINEGFTGAGVGIAKFEMWIYNRWGTSIYYTDDIAKPWYGKVLGKSQEAPQDVYVWKVEVKDIFGKKHNYVGHVTLLR